MKRSIVMESLAARLPEIRRRFGVKALYLFGSVARDEAEESSDIDLLVDFDGPASFDRYMGLKFYLEDWLTCKVDLVTRNAIRPAMKESIESEALHVA